MKWFLVGATAMVAMLGSPAWASSPLLLQEVLSDVMRAYPLLKAADQTREMAKAKHLAAQGGFDAAWRTTGANAPSGPYAQSRVDSVIEMPTPLWGATVFGGYRLGVGSFAPYDGKLETGSLGQWRAGAMIPLWRNGSIDRRRADLAQADVGLLAAAASVDEKRIEAVQKASTRYWDWVAAGRQREILKNLLAIAQQRNRDLAEAIRLGQVAPIEQAENERAILQREAQLVAAERKLQQAAIELSLFLRTPEGSPRLPEDARIPSALPEPAPLDAKQIERDRQSALTKRPEIRAVAAALDRGRIELSWAKNQLAPAADLGLSVSQGNGAGDRAIPELEASVRLDVPIQTRALRGRIDEATASLTQLDQQMRFARDRVEADVRDAVSAMSAARTRVEVARRELAVARKLENAERDRFRLGDSTLFIVNLREQSTAEAAIREVEAQADYQRALAAYRATIGTDAS